jgi:DNA-binding LacI/PurR family transcriptional regulator
MSERATLMSVARQAGVSRQTVSNVLNSPELVSPDTLDRVRRAIEEQGYRANRAARQMRTHRSQVIGLRIEPVRDGINGVVLDRFLHSLTATAERYDHRTMLFTATDDEAEIRAYADLVASVGVDAFVVTGTHHGDARTTWLREQDLPFVTFGRPWGAEHTHPWVDVDGATGTEVATAHLLRRGHRAIAFVGWPDGSGVGDDRRAGWRRALRGAGLPRGLDAAEPDRMDSGRTAAAHLLDTIAPPTAFVCASDSLALGVVAELRSRGLPWDAVIGFDDTPIAGFMGLTSIRQPIAEVAAACVRQLRTVLDGETPTPLLLTPELVVRQPS